VFVEQFPDILLDYLGQKRKTLCGEFRFPLPHGRLMGDTGVLPVEKPRRVRDPLVFERKKPSVV